MPDQSDQVFVHATTVRNGQDWLGVTIHRERVTSSKDGVTITPEIAADLLLSPLAAYQMASAIYKHLGAMGVLERLQGGAP